jgi:hypothetical protein
MDIILALQGNKDSGKSTTIGLLYRMLVNNNCIVIKKRRKYDGEDSHDFVVILELNGVKIGITTYGDAPSLILNRIEILIKAKCVIIICACHSSGGTVEILQNIRGYSTQPIPKTNNNDADARTLFNRIQQLIKKKTD